ncbi:adenosylcobinamide-GDP ribazoletransferase [Flavobacterium nitrogenifigens]|uniref:Adenosylcobinamide-GDP ribazoletransferase n=1 Tax=Flavobacterium nitrogenifigens TaxID=1617283 RepID=A0A521EKA3_9FLAO|nr:adenosylcobinamide-GDP ribazoletransferase [Flavobacterium nitrogenifigens]KAF2326155.1 adenosylcobinamide-GDP ribazoletransferase [Flavobacterium nitrogenifigens]SMO84333.1 cobalamin-5'-phosphate synthase [Flavobacterium nitrogenifigens]
MKKELHIFFTCLMFYTRIPCPKNITHHPDYLNKATRYFPFIGWIVGSISFLAFYLFSFFLSTEIAVILAIIASILTTGAFHEDGFADVCDGFGGGWTKEKILMIMKDSAIGAYGAIGLVLLFLLKFKLLSESILLFTNNILLVFLLFVSVHSLSRLAAISIIFTHEYSRDDASSKSKPIAKQYSWKEVFGSFFFGLIPLLVFSYFNLKFLLAIIPVFITRYFLARYFQKWIDGYTGDCLGATQQVCEVVFYLSILFLWKFI